MASEIKNVLLIGAAGNLGRPVLQEFLSSSAFNVTVLSRANSTSTFPSGATVQKIDYTTENLQKAFTGQDAVISLVGNEGFAEQQKIIDAAIAGGVKRFIPSEFGSNTADAKVRAIVPIFEGKRKVVEYLKSKESQISWSAVLTGGFADWGLQNGFLGFNLKSHSATIYDKGTVPTSLTTLSQIGRALISVLQHPSETANQYVYVSSATVTQQEILSALEKASGKKWETKDVDTKGLIAEGTEKLKNHDYSGIAPLIIGAIWGDFPDGPYGDWNKVGLWNSKLGLKEESIDSIVKSVL